MDQYGEMNMWEHLGKRRIVSCVATALHKLNSSPHSAPCRISRKRKRKVKNVPEVKLEISEKKSDVTKNIYNTIE